MPVKFNEQSLLYALKCGEEKDWEFKSAKGGLPGSTWETYSAMANTDGGVIVLGVDQGENSFTASGLDNPEKMKKNFWDTINNRGKVSQNLLSDRDVEQIEAGDGYVLAVHVPRASRRQRPVYVGQNPLDGTYRRNFEGDYKCRPEEVGRMLADQSEDSLDSRILEHFRLEDLDRLSIQQYRQRFSARAPAHPWLAFGTKAFLEKLGAWRQDRQTGLEGITVAGLLMFGKEEAIRDPLAVPDFHLDYREKLADDPAIRWTDRLTADGTWVCNLLQFYQRVVVRLSADIKIPFQLGPGLSRKDDTVVHEAAREALANALIHADYRGQGGIVMEKLKDRLEFSNPGNLLVGFDQLLKGGVSECRNKVLQQMFSLVGYGERAGSGIDKIRRGWASQKWRLPSIQEMFRPDRVALVLPMISFLPDESLQRLRKVFGQRLDGLTAVQSHALVTAEIEGKVSNGRLQEVCTDHPADLSRTLRGLVANGLLEQIGKGRWCEYRLPQAMLDAQKATLEPDEVTLPLYDVSPTHKDATSVVKGATVTAFPESGSAEADLQAIAGPARNKGKLPPEQMEDLIIALCQSRFLTATELAKLLSRGPGTTRRYLTCLMKRGAIQMRYPSEPNHPEQAYTTS